MFNLNTNSKLTIYEQIRDQMIEYILSGFFLPDQQLPTVRVLAKDLGINPNTVQKAYQELESNGYTYSLPSKGSFVADAKQLIKIHRQKKLDELKNTITDAYKIGIEKEQIESIVEEAAKGITL